MAGNSFGHDLTPLASVAKDAKSVLIFIHPQATFDAVAAALAWKSTWEKAEKSVSVVCSVPMRADYNRLPGIESVVTEAGNRDLVMSFPYDENIVDKVSYNVNEETQQFELIISPKHGYLPLAQDRIQYRQSGISADVVVLFGFHAAEELGEVYQKEKYAFDSAFTLAVTQSKVPAFAKFHVTLQEEGFSYSEWTYYMLRQLQLGQFTEEAATSLLQGVEYATDRLVTISNPRTFETVAQLMRANAKRQLDNPAFASLATPIEEPAPDVWQPQVVEPAASARPSRPQSNAVQQLGRTTQAQPVSPNEFAQAMGSRS